MRNRRMMFAVWLLAAAACEAAQTAYVVNVSSETLSSPAFLPAATFPGNGGVRVEDAAGRPVPADRLPGGEIVADLSVTAMTTAAYSIMVGTGALPMAVKESAGLISVETSRATYRFGHGGLCGVAAGDRVLVLSPLAGTNATSRIAFHGAAVTIVETAAGGKPATRWYVYRGGLVRLEAMEPVKLLMTDGDLQGWRYGPYQGTIGYHLEKVPAVEDEPFYVPGDLFAINSAAPLEWFAAVSDRRKAGLFAMPEPGSTMRFLPEGKKRRDLRKLVKEIQGHVIDFSPADPVVRKHTEVQFLPGKDGPGRFLLAFVRDAREGHALRSETSHYLVFTRQDDGFRANLGGREILVTDANRNGMPDTAGDEWLLAAGGRETAFYRFIPFATDPRQEGNALHISFDRNRNGKIDPEEKASPEWRFCDWNQDRLFFRGNLLEGGRLEQDACYQRSSGSPDGKLWDRRWYALDLDGDGDQDISVSDSLFNFSAKGVGGWGTAGNQDGARLDYSDKDYAFVFLIQPFDHSVRFIQVDYDCGQFYRYTATYINAWMKEEDGFYKGDEEHHEYEGFATGIAAAHIYGYGGLIFGIKWAGFLGGNWKLGVDFDVMDPKYAFKPSEGRLQRIVYTDPWGHSFKVVSMLTPLQWDGKALAYRSYDGHLDCIDQTPWLHILDVSPPSRATINAEEEFGNSSCEAGSYLFMPTGRQEWARDNRTSYVFYYSDLVGGLHHQGIYKGESKDGRLVYFDRDDDGVVDCYMYDPDGDRRFAKRLWYDAEAGRITLYDHGRCVSWHEPLSFPGYKMYLENYGKIEALYRRGLGVDPLVVIASVDDAGRVQGHKLPPNADLRAEKMRMLRLGVETGHGGSQGILVARQEDGLGVLAATFARWGYDLREVGAVTEQGALNGLDLLMVQAFEKPWKKEETAALRQWVENGGVFLVTPAALTPEARDGANALLRALGVKDGFADTKVDNDFKCLRIPDQGNIVGDVVEERHPRLDNKVDQYRDYTKCLLDCCRYIAFTGYPIETAEDSAMQMHLAHRIGNHALIGSIPAGRGEVFLCAFPLLANRFIRPPVHYYLRSSNEQLAENFVEWMGERIRMRGASVWTERYGLRERTHVSNGRVQIGVTRDIGGRLQVFCFDGDPYNILRMETGEYSYQAKRDVYPGYYGYNYGGLRDVHEPDWPGIAYNDLRYGLRVDDQIAKGGPIGIAVWGAAEGLKSERTMTLLSSSSTLRIDVKITNLQDQYRDVMCRLNGEYRCGPKGSWTIFPGTNGALTKVEYVLGREEGRGFRPCAGGWIALVDVASQTAMLIRYPREKAEKILLWTGAGTRESASHTYELEDDYFGFTGIGIFQKPELTPPGSQVTFYQEHSLYKGLTGIDLVEGDIVAQYEVVQEHGTKAKIRIGAARAQAGTPFVLKVEIVDSDGKKLEGRDLRFSGALAGQAEWHEWKATLAPGSTVRLSSQGQAAGEPSATP